MHWADYLSDQACVSPLCDDKKTKAARRQPYALQWQTSYPFMGIEHDLSLNGDTGSWPVRPWSHSLHFPAMRPADSEPWFDILRALKDMGSYYVQALA